jgi:hypothetical protein
MVSCEKEVFGVWSWWQQTTPHTNVSVNARRKPLLRCRLSTNVYGAPALGSTGAVHDYLPLFTAGDHGDPSRQQLGLTQTSLLEQEPLASPLSLPRHMDHLFLLLSTNGEG